MLRTVPQLAKCLAPMLACLLAYADPVAAQQPEAAIPQAQLREPWVKQLAALQSVVPHITQLRGEAERGRMADALATLEVSLGEYEHQIDDVIDRLAADRQFVFAAGETSQTLANQLADIHSRFATVYTAAGAQERPGVLEAQGALADLQHALAAKRKFEQDVENAMSSGLRAPVVALATRWWQGEEQAIAVKQLAGDLRRQLDNLPPQGNPPEGSK